MTPSRLERDWLSLRVWLTRCVLPSALVLLAILGFFRFVTDDQSLLNHNAVIVGFFALYFVLIRGGHMIMVRSLHRELLRKHETAYRTALAGHEDLKRANIGFTLARIKRQILNDLAAQRKTMERKTMDRR